MIKEYIVKHETEVNGWIIDSIYPDLAAACRAADHMASSFSARAWVGEIEATGVHDDNTIGDVVYVAQN